MPSLPSLRSRNATKLSLAAASLLGALAAAGAPLAASADPGSTVQADVTSLSGAVTTAQTTLLADLQTLTTDAQAGNIAAVRADLVKYRSDRAALIAPIRGDRSQLVSDAKAAKQAGVTGLGAIVKPALVSERSALQQLRHAVRQARLAVRTLRREHRGAADAPAASTPGAA